MKNADYYTKVISFIDTINSNYIINDDGFLYFEDKKIAISINEKYESSNLYKEPNYYINLHNKYENLGIRLIIIFDFQIDSNNWDKLKSMITIAIGNPKKIYARQCEIRKISNDEAKKLNNAIHLQGHRNAQVTYGLFYNNELVQLMSFSQMKWNRNLKNDNEWEIIRGCPGSNNIVVGGCSKCFKHFIKDYNPNVIFSYCDANLFNGASYKAIGMCFAGNTGKNKWWILDEEDPNTHTHGWVIPRNPAKYKEYKQRSHNTIIWGAGSDRYVWVKDGYKYSGKGKEFLEKG